MGVVKKGGGEEQLLVHSTSWMDLKKLHTMIPCTNSSDGEQIIGCQELGLERGCILKEQH